MPRKNSRPDSKTGADLQMSSASRLAHWDSFAANPRAFDSLAQDACQTQQSEASISSIHRQPEASVAPDETNESVPKPGFLTPTPLTDGDLTRGLSTMSIEATRLSFETLPAEIMAMILENLTYRRDLWTVTETVPAARRAFNSSLEQVFTKVTLSDLVERGIYLLSPAAAVEVRTKLGEEPEFALRPALSSIQWQLQDHGKRSVRLTFDECNAINTLYDYVKWEVIKDGSDGLTDVSFFSDPLHHESYWEEHQTYFTFALGPYETWQELVEELVHDEWEAEDFDELSKAKKIRREKMRTRKRLHAERYSAD